MYQAPLLGCESLARETNPTPGVRGTGARDYYSLIPTCNLFYTATRTAVKRGLKAKSCISNSLEV